MESFGEQPECSGEQNQCLESYDPAALGDSHWLVQTGPTADRRSLQRQSVGAQNEGLEKGCSRHMGFHEIQKRQEGVPERGKVEKTAAGDSDSQVDLQGYYHQTTRNPGSSSLRHLKSYEIVDPHASPRLQLQVEREAVQKTQLEMVQSCVGTGGQALGKTK